MIKIVEKGHNFKQNSIAQLDDLHGKKQSTGTKEISCLQ